mgnify:CR=1 FL=1
MEPHLLMMSATPIPRTLAMSYYADLDVSTIDELPPGRTPVVTKVISDQRRGDIIERIRAQVAEGRQVYWVCPLIEESEALDLTNATATHESLSEALPGVVVGLLHSRMPQAEKKAVMSLFTGGQMGVLVSTTVIEVGVDVPNASLMVIEHAERFGLSQLHQLRGRVGRGAAASACVLLYATNDSGRVGETAKERLRAMAETTDGFEIARRDLEIRGPGEFLGALRTNPLLRKSSPLWLILGGSVISLPLILLIQRCGVAESPEKTATAPVIEKVGIPAQPSPAPPTHPEAEDGAGSRKLIESTSHAASPASSKPAGGIRSAASGPIKVSIVYCPGVTLQCGRESAPQPANSRGTFQSKLRPSEGCRAERDGKIEQLSHKEILDQAGPPDHGGTYHIYRNQKSSLCR